MNIFKSKTNDYILTANLPVKIDAIFNLTIIKNKIFNKYLYRLLMHKRFSYIANANFTKYNCQGQVELPSGQIRV